MIFMKHPVATLLKNRRIAILFVLLVASACFGDRETRCHAQPIANEAERRAEEALAGPSGETVSGQPDAVSSDKTTKGQTLLELFLAGGVLMWPITLMSVVVVLFGVERALALRPSKIVPRSFIRDLGEITADGPFDPRKVYRLCQQNPSVVSTVVRAMLGRLGRPMSEVEHAVSETKDREASHLYANIRPIGLAVTVTPLMGLLGTVQGMILAFYTTANLQAGANRAAELAQGIYVALITTFAGLCVAIPAAILAHYLEGRIINSFRKVDGVVESLLPQVERYENVQRVTARQLASETPARSSKTSAEPVSRPTLDASSKVSAPKIQG